MARGAKWDAEPPWRRYVVFTAEGRPTGWAMGISSDHAIRRWLALDDNESLADADIKWRWRHWQSQGYTVRAVDLTLAPEDTTAIAEARREGG